LISQVESWARKMQTFSVFSMRERSLLLAVSAVYFCVKSWGERFRKPEILSTSSGVSLT